MPRDAIVEIVYPGSLLVQSLTHLRTVSRITERRQAISCKTPNGPSRPDKNAGRDAKGLQKKARLENDLEQGWRKLSSLRSSFCERARSMRERTAGAGKSGIVGLVCMRASHRNFEYPHLRVQQNQPDQRQGT